MCINSTFQLLSLKSKSMISCTLCTRWCVLSELSLHVWSSLWKWETYFKCRAETSEAAVTCHCEVLFLYHVTHVVVCEQLIFLLLFLQDFLSITWTRQAILNLYFLNVCILNKTPSSPDLYLKFRKLVIRYKSGLMGKYDCFFKILDQKTGVI